MRLPSRRVPPVVGALVVAALALAPAGLSPFLVQFLINLFMFRCAAECLAGQVPDEDLAAGAIYPRVRDLRRVSTRIAEAVAREARDSGMGKARSDEAISRAVREAQWEPVYQPFV